MKKKIIIIAALCVIIAAAAIYAHIAFFGGTDAHTAEIRSDGTLIRTIDLRTAPDEPFVVSGSGGTNTVCVKTGSISVTEASCPDKICVKHGELRSELLPIICLPNRLEITLK